MYWRVQKISPEQVAKTYGVHAVCIVSVLANLIMLSKVAPSNKLTDVQRINYDTFARNVTRHIIDGCFLTYETSMYQLEFAGDQGKSGTTCELGPSVTAKLQQDGVIPKSVDEMKAMSRQLKSQFSITQIAIDSVKIDEPSQSSQGLVPIDVTARVVKSSSEGPMQPTPVHFRYLVGARKDNQLPIVARFDDLSGQGPPPGTQ